MRPCGSDGLLAAALAVSAMVVLSCATTTVEDTTARPPREAATEVSPVFGGATFEVDAPFSQAVLEIEPNGTMRYKASSPRTGIAQQLASRQVDHDAIARLMEAVEEAEFYALKADYPYRQGVSYEDGSTYAVQVTIDEETKRVTCYQSECPQRLKRVMNAIREIWGGEILEVGV